MKKVMYTAGMVRRAETAKSTHRDLVFNSFEVRLGFTSAKVDQRVIAEQVAASMAIEDRAVQPERIVVESTKESKRALADVLSIRNRNRRQPPDDDETVW
ncbi:hypothetical protein V1638_16400 [Pseudarthrobacter sp. J64]|uniref:hypothetical protein n=1 Tax=Pseudarthrobacter sp. J64 TaxID=3116485 RepID=UPI002E8108C5|nr:hypothetical protein [Pseudarthrobacter sp. J64]MEE2570958.1 hypothetical protein [Pseudarthrobacter sp. J64]